MGRSAVEIKRPDFQVIIYNGDLVIQIKMLLQQIEKSLWHNSIRFLRNNKKWLPRPEPETFEQRLELLKKIEAEVNRIVVDVVFPPNGEYKLPPMPEEPTYDPALGEQKFKTSKQLVSIRGVEEIHTELIHRQYGLAAVAGGFISSHDFNFIRDRLNRNLLKNQFAIWRVPAPWLPRTKRAVGAKSGSGKGNIHYYVTPVRAKRIILELGGYVMELEARAYLMHLCERFRFPVEFVSEKILEEKKLQEKKVEEMNVNKFNWDLALKYNMQDCHRWLSYYDIAFKCDEELLFIPFRWFILVTAGLPFSALCLCISLSLALHLDESTRTHCGVVNYLPSISAAVASFSPERYIWRFFVALHSAPRIVAALAFKNFLLTSPLRPLNDRIWFELACQIACFVNIAESLFLLLLTTASSTESHAIHKISFLGFGLCSILYMLSATSLLQYSGRRRTSSLDSTTAMVFFSCDKCSEALKKNQVEKHGFKCRNATYSCLDCGQAFSRVSYKDHIRCVTENKKYGGKNYTEKENKGEAKQNRWIEQVERAIENVRDQGLKDLLQQIHGFNNIPRKEAKFVNFLQNSIKIRDRSLCVKAWNCISEQALKMQQEAEKTELNENEGCNSQDEKKSLNCKQETSGNDSGKVEKMKTKKKELKENGASENDHSNSEQKIVTTNGVKKFKWKRAIKRTLKEAENGQMKMKRLRTKVIESYLASGQCNGNAENPEAIFNVKLQSLGLQLLNVVIILDRMIGDSELLDDFYCNDDEPVAPTLFTLCIRQLALKQNGNIDSLPSSIVQKIVLLNYNINHMIEIQHDYVTFEYCWICIGKDCNLDWPNIYKKCFRGMKPEEFFIFSAINGIATEALWQRMNDEEKEKLRHSKNEILRHTALLMLDPSIFKTIQYKSITVAAYHGWPGAMFAWLGSRNESLQNVNYEEMILDKLNIHHSLTFNPIELSILIAIHNRQYHLLRYLPVANVTNSFHHLFPYGHVPLHFMRQLFNIPSVECHLNEKLSNYLRSVACSLVEWMSEYELRRFRRQLAATDEFWINVNVCVCVKRVTQTRLLLHVRVRVRVRVRLRVVNVGTDDLKLS
uniref:39S ribosomal protein L16, mitochondrial n=1 Tax=Setaria digitata TaxID=48799 RepID=A0A915PRG8_9BILA